MVLTSFSGENRRHDRIDTRPVRALRLSPAASSNEIDRDHFRDNSTQKMICSQLTNKAPAYDEQLVPACLFVVRARTRTQPTPHGAISMSAEGTILN